MGLNCVDPLTLGLFPTVTTTAQLDLRLGESADSEEARTGRATFTLYSIFNYIEVHTGTVQGSTLNRE